MTEKLSQQELSFRAYNAYFSALQREIEKNNPNLVFKLLSDFSELVLNRNIPLALFIYLATNIDPNSVYNTKNDISHYEKNNQVPFNYLRGKLIITPDKRHTGDGFGLLIALIDHTRTVLEKRIQNRPAVDHAYKDAKIQGYVPVDGTPFDKNWKIRPPKKN